MLSDALSYPQSGDGWRSVVIGGLLMVFNWLLLPAFIVWGYYVRVLRGAALEEDEAPRFEDGGELLADGFKSFLIFLGYIFLPLLLVGVLVGSTAAIGGENGGVVLSLLVGLLGMVFMLGMVYLFPVAMTTFALTDRLGAAFEVGTIVRSAFTGDYAVGVLLTVVLRAGVGMAIGMVMYIVQIVFGFIFVFGMFGFAGGEADPAMGVGMMLVVFLVGLLVYLLFLAFFTIVNFYAGVAGYYLLGRGCGPSLLDALPVERPTPDETSRVGPERPRDR